MNKKGNITIKTGLSFPGIIFLVLLVLKLVIPTCATLSWWVVFLPLYIVPAIVLGIIVFVLGIGLFFLIIAGIVILIAGIITALS